MGLLSAIGTGYNEEETALLKSFLPAPKLPGRVQSALGHAFVMENILVSIETVVERHERVIIVVVFVGWCSTCANSTWLS